MLHHFGMLWIIENYEQFKYDMDIQNSNWLTGGPCYNTSICNKLHGNCSRGLLKMHELTDIISCVLLIHMKKSINSQYVVMAAAVGVVH